VNHQLPVGHPQSEPVRPAQPLTPGDPRLLGEPALDPLAGPLPWERRQPQVQRRSVLPVDFFRRMPGGGTTYAPLAGDAGSPEQD
jgi:hypothetical protein